jgi:hypothetical protein
MFHHMDELMHVTSEKNASHFSVDEGILNNW